MDSSSINIDLSLGDVDNVRVTETYGGGRIATHTNPYIDPFPRISKADSEKDDMEIETQKRMYNKKMMKKKIV